MYFTVPMFCYKVYDTFLELECWVNEYECKKILQLTPGSGCINLQIYQQCMEMPISLIPE